jgi:hypothetical protein
MSLPQTRASAPILVVYGGKDPIIPSQTTSGALAVACGMGDVIVTRGQTDKGHTALADPSDAVEPTP